MYVCMHMCVLCVYVSVCVCVCVRERERERERESIHMHIHTHTGTIVLENRICGMDHMRLGHTRQRLHIRV